MNKENILTEEQKEIIITSILLSAGKFDDIDIKDRYILLEQYKQEIIDESKRWSNTNFFKAFNDIILFKKTITNPLQFKFEYSIYAKALCDLISDE